MNGENRKKVEKILKKGRRTRQSSAAAEANVTNVASADVANAIASSTSGANENADSICWFCHADVSSLEKSKCAGCRKVTNLPFSPHSLLISFVSGALL